MNAMQWFFHKKKMSAAERKFEEKNKWIGKQHEREEREAAHKGKLKYLEREAAKGTHKTSGLGGFFGEGIKTLGQNLAAGAGETSMGGFGGGLDHGISGGKRGGGLGFNPITGESYGGSKHKHHKHHRSGKHSKDSGKTITIHLG